MEAFFPVNVAGRYRRAAASWVTVLTGLAAAQGLTALAMIVLARSVSPAIYGQYLAAFGLVSILAVLPAFGFESWLLTGGAADAQRVAHLWRGAFRARIALLAPWFILVAALAALLPAATFPPLVLWFSALSAAGDGFTALTYAALRNVNAHRQVTLYQSVSAAILLMIALLLPLGEMRIVWFAAARAVFSSGVALALIVRTRCLLPQAAAAPLREVVRQAQPFFLGEAAVSVYMRADLLIVSAFLGAVGSGVYGPALNLANMSFLAPNALYLLVVPQLSHRHRSALPAYRRLGGRQLAAQVLTGAVMSILMWLLAPLLVTFILGPTYAASVSVLRVLSIILFVKAVSFGLAALLTSSGNQKQRTAVQVVAAALNLAANLAVVPRWGVMGAATVYVISELLLCAGYAVATWRTHRTLSVAVEDAGRAT